MNKAGPAHRMTAVDHMLPPLRLTIEKQTKEGKQYITDPIEVAKEHSKPWEAEWNAFDPAYQISVVKLFRKLRSDCLEEAAEYAHNIDATAEKKQEPH